MDAGSTPACSTNFKISKKGNTMAITQQTDSTYRKNTRRKKTRQGAGKGTKYGRSKGTIQKYRGQGGPRKSVKR